MRCSFKNKFFSIKLHIKDTNNGQNNFEVIYMLSNINNLLQIIDILAKWCYLLFKHHRITLGVILFFNLLSFLLSEEKQFPWLSFFIVLYFSILFFRKFRLKNNHSDIPSIYIENKNYLLFNQIESLSRKKDK